MDNEMDQQKQSSKFFKNLAMFETPGLFVEINGPNKRHLIASTEHPSIQNNHE